MHFRKAETEDLHEIGQLFKRSIEGLCTKEYSPAQIQAWSSSIENTEAWLNKIEQSFFLLAISNTNSLTGMISFIQPNYLDLLFVDPEYAGKGIARAMFEHFEDEALKTFSGFLEVHSSDTAKGFFLKNGFSILAEEVTQRKGIDLRRWYMNKWY